jgi:hypothetical protein
MAKEKFTVKQGLAVQAADLAFWQKLLKKRNYAKLQAAVAYENTHNEHRDGYDVMRGSDITSAVQSLGESLQKAKAKLKTAAVNHYDGALPTLI